MLNQIAIAIKKEHLDKLFEISEEDGNEELYVFLITGDNDGPYRMNLDYSYLYCEKADEHREAIAQTKTFLRNLPLDKKGEYQYDLLEIVDGKIQREGNGSFLSIHYTIDFC